MFLFVSWTTKNVPIFHPAHIYNILLVTYVSSICPYLLCLATDALGTGLDSRRINTLLCAVGVDHAEFMDWLPGPPGAVLVLCAELVTALRIFSCFEVDGIFL